MENNFQWTDELVAKYSLQSQELTLWDFKRKVMRDKKAIDDYAKKVFEESIKEVKPNCNYEILEYGWAQNNENKPDLQYISKVKRLSDKETFAIHDITNYGIIQNFYIGWAGMEVHFKDGCGATLNLIKKVKPQPKLLFTTPKNENIYEGEEYFYMPIETLAWINKVCKGNPQPPECFYYFKTKEDAELYQLNNKPISVTMKDILVLWAVDYNLFQRMVENFFKEKLNT